MPCQRWMEPFLSEPLKSARPVRFPKPTTATSSDGNTRVLANITCDIFSSSRLVSSGSACLSLSVVLAQFSTVSLRRKRQLSRRAGRKRAGEQIRIEQQSAGLRTAGARPLFDPRLAAHAFLTANPQHQPKSHRTAPHCTAPHRSASRPALRTFNRPACLFAAACHSQQSRRAVVTLPASHPAVVAVSIRKTSAPTGVAPAAAPHSSLPGSTSMLDTIPTLLSLIIFLTY